MKSHVGTETVTLRVTGTPACAACGLRFTWVENCSHRVTRPRRRGDAEAEAASVQHLRKQARAAALTPHVCFNLRSRKKKPLYSGALNLLSCSKLWRWGE